MKNIDAILKMKMQANMKAPYFVRADFSAAAKDLTACTAVLDRVENAIVKHRAQFEGREADHVVFRAPGEVIQFIAEMVDVPGLKFKSHFPPGGFDRMAHRPDPEPDGGRGAAVRRDQLVAA